MNHVVGDAETGAIYGGGGNEWFGPAVWKSTDLGKNWTHSSAGLAYEAGEEPIKARVERGAAETAASMPACSRPGCSAATTAATTGSMSTGLQKHPSRPQWNPGGAGLILHTLVLHPEDEDRSGSASRRPASSTPPTAARHGSRATAGTRADFLPEGQNYPEFGQCVHNLVMAPAMPDRLYQQNHCGMYRSDDGGQAWQSIENGLPSSFGFPAAAHPRDPDTAFLIPLNGDSEGRYVPDAKAAVWRTRDAGKSWEDLREGLPQQNAYFGVLRQAMATDRLEPAGIYFGTSTGTLFASADEGDSWMPIAEHLPTISSVETLVVER